MAIPNIDKQLSALGEAVIKAIQDRFTFGEITPYPYQCVAYTEIAKRMKNYEHPFFVKASVSAGKTMIFAMVAAQCQRMGLKMMVLARRVRLWIRIQRRSAISACLTPFTALR
ncbi:DNA helicase [Enterobacter phage N5822]|nr:DNA helicase [Enterobacter phage N5822]QPD96283.1 DNA helicase [Enterobacter phage N5822]